MDVVILGAFPPPLGGNSVHIQRLYTALNTHGLRVAVLDYLGVGPASTNADVVRLHGGWLQKLRAVASFAATTPPRAVIHMHVSGMGKFKWVAPFLITCFRRQPRILTIHSGSFVRQADRVGLRAYLSGLLKRFNEVVVVNDEQRRFLVRIGLSPHRVHVIPAFLLDESEIASESPLPAGTGNGKAVVVTSGYLTPLYNYDVLIDCAARLPADQFHFVFAFYHEVDAPYEGHVLSRLQDLPNVTVLRDRTPGEFLAVLRGAHIYVRATLADGDAVAVREALHFGKIVLASTAAPRPSACRLFPPSDRSALETLLRRVGRPGSVADVERIPEQEQLDTLSALLRVYAQALSASGPETLLVTA